MAAVVVALAAMLAGCSRPADSPGLPDPADPGYADAWITQRVVARLETDRHLRAYHFHVQTHDRVVWVQGAVPSDQLRQRVEQVVSQVPRVEAVRSNILVISQRPPGM